MQALDSTTVQDPRRATGDTPDLQRHRHSPVRTCVGCRKRDLTGELLRVVAADGRLVVDERRRLPGRGAWLHPGPDCLAKAERKRAFPRALRVQGALDAAGLHDHAAFAADNDAGTPPGSRETRKQVDPS